jgi:hypothetical protein
VTLGLVVSTAPDGAPVVLGIRDESHFGPPQVSLEVLAADRSAATAASPSGRGNCSARASTSTPCATWPHD